MARLQSAFDGGVASVCSHEMGEEERWPEFHSLAHTCMYAGEMGGSWKAGVLMDRHPRGVQLIVVGLCWESRG